jgi:hypothetical protein
MKRPCPEPHRNFASVGTVVAQSGTNWQHFGEASSPISKPIKDLGDWHENEGALASGAHGGSRFGLAQSGTNWQRFGEASSPISKPIKDLGNTHECAGARASDRGDGLPCGLAQSGTKWQHFGHDSSGGYRSANPKCTLLLKRRMSAITMLIPVPRWPNGAASRVEQKRVLCQAASDAVLHNRKARLRRDLSRVSKRSRRAKKWHWLAAGGTFSSMRLWCHFDRDFLRVFSSRIAWDRLGNAMARFHRASVLPRAAVPSPRGADAGRRSREWR